MIKLGLEGALAGRQASERAVVESGGRRSGGAGMGFTAAYQLPFLRAAMNRNAQMGQEQVTAGGLENQQRQQNLQMIPVTGPDGKQYNIPQSAIPNYVGTTMRI